ncbi:hypothetical protein Q8F55_003123 [Vanrija albida]|uniref:DUF4219 domain-containing protein n=1 Tax=Vanrija albida TaxID=181172 RepID=A0ABR3QBP7_9TREE
MSTNISWADVSDNVPTLHYPSDFEAWSIKLREYCFAKGVLPHLDGVVPEPFRSPTMERKGWAGTQEPIHQEIDHRMFEHLLERRAKYSGMTLEALQRKGIVIVLPLKQLQMWDRWAEKERLARMAILKSIAPFHVDGLGDLPTAHEMYKKLAAAARAE